MGIFGVIANLPALEPFRQPMVPIDGLSAVSVAVLVISVSVTLKRTQKEIQNSSKQSKPKEVTQSLKKETQLWFLMERCCLYPKSNSRK